MAEETSEVAGGELMRQDLYVSPSLRLSFNLLLQNVSYLPPNDLVEPSAI